MSEITTVEEAENLVRHVIAERERWGRLYDASNIGITMVLDALVFLYEHESTAVTDLRESLRASQQQLGAAKAREARLNKINKELRGENDEAQSDGVSDTEEV